MERLRILGCDHLNLARGKYLASSKLKTGSTRLCQGIYAVTYNRDLLPAPGSKMLEGLPDLTAMWDADKTRGSWRENEKILITDYYETDGTPLPMCGRQTLKRTIKEWNALGYAPKIGIELEAYAFIKDDNGALNPIETLGSFVYSTGVHSDPYKFTDAIWEAAHRAHLPLEVITTEYDASQFEFVLTFNDALEAVDNIFLFKLLAREIALEHDIILTFMAKPIVERGGNGVHVNFSFTDEKGDNAISKGGNGGVENLSDLGQKCVAGLLKHHKALAGLIAPTVNSYERLQPASMSGYWQNWGGDHRSVTTRVSTEGGKKARIEHRMADSGSNPYVMTAAVLQAAKLGVENDHPLPAPETGDGFENVNTTIGVGADLAEALNDLEADTLFASAIGHTLVENHIFIKRAEIEEVAACEGAEAKRDYYIHYI